VSYGVFQKHVKSKEKVIINYRRILMLTLKSILGSMALNASYRSKNESLCHVEVSSEPKKVTSESVRGKYLSTGEVAPALAKNKSVPAMRAKPKKK